MRRQITKMSPLEASHVECSTFIESSTAPAYWTLEPVGSRPLRIFSTSATFRPEPPQAKGNKIAAHTADRRANGSCGRPSLEKRRVTTRQNDRQVIGVQTSGAKGAALLMVGVGGEEIGAAAVEVYGDITAAASVVKAAKTDPLPPGWNQNWKQLPGTRDDAGFHWFDEKGGEWRLHKVDKYHPTAHWSTTRGLPGIRLGRISR